MVGVTSVIVCFGFDSQDDIFSMVALAGLEPARSCEQRILSPPCLPFHHRAILVHHVTILKLLCECQMYSMTLDIVKPSVQSWLMVMTIAGMGFG